MFVCLFRSLTCGVFSVYPLLPVCLLFIFVGRDVCVFVPLRDSFSVRINKINNCIP